MGKLAFTSILAATLSAPLFAGVQDHPSDHGCWVWAMDDGNRVACIDEAIVRSGYQAAVGFDEYDEPGIWYINQAAPYSDATFFKTAGRDL